jgi:glycerate 2-kinase
LSKSKSRDPRAFLRALFDAAVAAAQPGTCVPPHLPPPPKGRTVVVGAGKAAAAMAQAVEAHWPGPLEGLVVTRHGQKLPTRFIEVAEGSHPVPDAEGEAAARRMLALVRGLGADDLVLCLMSGGASAILALPAEGLTLADKQEVNRALLRSGATIHEMNCVRKHLSGIKGGRLAAACGAARVVTLAISDVPGDDPSVIGSGPTVPDPTTFADARAILAKYGITPPAPVAKRLASGPEQETPKPGDPRLARASYQLVATPQISLEAAAKAARAAGIVPLILSDSIEGEAREVARAMAAIARQAVRFDQPAPAPCVLLSGGEATVTVRGKGKGGRNTEFLLALALALGGAPGIAALAGGTDGIDGTEDNAGAVILPDTLARAARAGLEPRAMLDDNDAYSFFSALGDLLVTGPTQTNVNDFRAILVDARNSPG